MDTMTLDEIVQQARERLEMRREVERQAELAREQADLARRQAILEAGRKMFPGELHHRVSIGCEYKGQARVIVGGDDWAVGVEVRFCDGGYRASPEYLALMPMVGEDEEDGYFVSYRVEEYTDDLMEAISLSMGGDWGYVRNRVAEPRFNRDQPEPVYVPVEGDLPVPLVSVNRNELIALIRDVVQEELGN